MFAGQEARLLEALRLVHQLVSFLNVTGLFEAPHDHRIQFWVLKTRWKEMSQFNYIFLLISFVQKVVNKSLSNFHFHFAIIRIRFCSSLRSTNNMKEKQQQKFHNSLSIPYGVRFCVWCDDDQRENEVMIVRNDEWKKIAIHRKWVVYRARRYFADTS